MEIKTTKEHRAEGVSQPLPLLKNYFVYSLRPLAEADGLFLCKKTGFSTEGAGFAEKIVEKRGQVETEGGESGGYFAKGREGEEGRLSFWGKALKNQAFSHKKIERKRSFGLVFLRYLYYNVDRSGEKWLLVVEILPKVVRR